MADLKISQLTSDTLGASDYIPIQRSTSNYKLNLKTSINAVLTEVFTGQSLSGSQDTSLLSLSAIWNTTGTPTAFKVNVTDTASNASSLLADFQVGGVSKFTVNKAGEIGGANTISAFYNLAEPASSFGFSLGTPVIYKNGTKVASFAASGVSLGGFLTIGSISSPDLYAYRDAANVWAQRNGANAQTHRIYNTYTDASNYERGVIGWSANTLTIGTEKAGTGSARALEFQTNGTTRLTINTAGVVAITGSLSASNYIAVPSANGLIPLGGGASDYIKMANNSGNEMLRFYNGATNPMLSFAGVAATSPAIKRSSTTLQGRLADDSAFCAVQGKITTDAAYSAGAPTPTGYVVIYDSTGTAYKIPAEAV